MEPRDINPYAAPLAEAPVAATLPGAAIAGRYGPYRDNRKLAAWLVGLLLFGLAYNMTRGALNLAYTLTDFGVDQERFATIEGVMTAVGFSGLACVIVFGTWIVRAGKNGWLFAEVSRMRMRPGFSVRQAFLNDTPGWAVGWYFIPIANLWKPFAAMRDIVATSTSGQALPSFLLPMWWALWIVSLFAERFSLALGEGNFEFSLGAEAVLWGGISAVEVALHGVAIVLVRSITALQAGTAAELAEDSPGESAPLVTA